MKTVWLVMEGDYEATVASVHASEESARAWILANILDGLKDRLKIDLELADDAAERREARKNNRESVVRVKSGDMGDYHIYEEMVLDEIAMTRETP